MRMYDIHMHIIPGVDDGSWDMHMSRQLLFMAYEQGIRKIIATPHSSAFGGKDHEVEKQFQQLQEMVRKILPDMQLYLGCEVRCSNSEMNSILKGLKEHRIPTLNNTKYVLTEFSPSIEHGEAFACVQSLLEEDLLPVLAHAERYNHLFEQEGCIEELQSMGCMFQMNVYSVYEEENERIKKNALYLIERKLVTFLGSDAHRTIHRPPSVRYGLQYLYEHFEREYMNEIVFGNARRLLNMREDRTVIRDGCCGCDWSTV